MPQHPPPPPPPPRSNGGEVSAHSQPPPPAEESSPTEQQPPMSSSSLLNGQQGGRVGPHPGFISSSNQYSAEIKLRRLLKDNGCDPAREDSYRLQGVQLIDNVREYLQLPVRTFDTACTYYHKFRLNFRDSEYNYQDAALASLFVACKVEDTIKKSRDILAAAYNVKNPDKPAVAPDDKIFESPGKVIIGLERLILETIGFDFRTRYPQKLVVKLVRSLLGCSAHAKAFFATAYAVCLDMYKTFVPIKRTTLVMATAVIELTARLRNEHLEKVHDRFFSSSSSSSSSLSNNNNNSHHHPHHNHHHRRRHHHQSYKQCRDAVMETMLDLLDLYVQHHKSTRLGSAFDLSAFIDIKIRLNNDLDDSASPRFLFHCSRCEVADANPLTPIVAPPPTITTTTTTTTTNQPSSSSSPFHDNFNDGGGNNAVWPPDASIRRTARGQDGTMRFVFDPEAADDEQVKAAQFFTRDFEDVEVEVEEPLPPLHPPHHHPPSASSYERDPHYHPGSRSSYRGGYRDRGDHRRGGGGPYGGYRGDGWHHRGRGRYY
ncbi:hypothetical protein CP532_0051 [Ophiocordyceps camponoti-leonardi (nom. inval.)]|nr:hypothetical protein CP532_0051 [Ophiocordyceps camponoti-leonardi (nom. inval.)]